MRVLLLTIAAVASAALAASGQGVRAQEISPAAAADLGSKIAFVTDRVGREAPDEIYVMNGDGTDERRVTMTESGNSLFPDWSPNGKTISFHNNPVEIGGPEIFLINDDGAGLTRLTHMSEPEVALGAVNPSWSPTGKKVAFNSVVNADICVINVDGTGLTRLTDHPANDARPDWSPDGRRIVFNSNRDGNPEIYAMNSDGTGEVRLTAAPGADMGPEWSPDGRKIAFESSRDGNREIYAMNADGTDQIRLTSNSDIDAFPSWSPNGRNIIFHRQLVQLPGLDPPNGSELFVVTADGSQETQLTHMTPASFSAFASWSQGHASAPSADTP